MLEFMVTLAWLMTIFFWLVIILVFVYALVRGISFAYFRSRYEYHRMLHRLRRNQEDKTNGKV